jgi:hypothetical protein
VTIVHDAPAAPSALHAQSVPTLPLDVNVNAAISAVLARESVISSPPPPVQMIPPSDDARQIESMLGRYKQAYGALDVSATSQIWPSVERRSLARAFATLKSQSVAFASCAVRIQGFTAVALCDGTVEFVRAVGSSDPRIERQQWTFTLRRRSGQWQIEDVVAIPQGRTTRAAVDAAPSSGAMQQNAALAASPSMPR